MQYVGKVGGYMYNQWNSLNPATLSGAIDVIVVEQNDGSLYCLPFHIRFGKFQIIKPLQKKIDVYINGSKTDLPMKLGEGGEAFFVFEIDDTLLAADLLSKSVMTSPVISAASLPPGSPPMSPSSTVSALNTAPASGSSDVVPESPIEGPSGLDGDALTLNDSIEEKSKLSTSPPPSRPFSPRSPRATLKAVFEKARAITESLNIPSKIDINGDMVLDMDGYKADSQKNQENSEEIFNKIFAQEMEHASGALDNHWSKFFTKDLDGKLRIRAQSDDEDYDQDQEDETSEPESDSASYTETETAEDSRKYFKTLRLTSDQLKKMDLKYGENELIFKSHEGTSQIQANLYLWKLTDPIVISDIDGTITKSDVVGHVFNLIGRDWTHTGVAKMFLDIHLNGYNIMYLTARSVGQADSTRQYLRNITQDGEKLPPGPVILLPDRTMAALRREVILKKPEVFKMSCLGDIRNLYFSTPENAADQDADAVEDTRTPFYAGFGNRITDAISYRSVHIPSHRIFTINPDGEVHMELLEIAGYKSSYLHIGELVDHFFPPMKKIPTRFWDQTQFDEYMEKTDQLGPLTPPGSPGARSINSGPLQRPIFDDERYTDVNYWREPLPNLSDFSSDEEDENDSKFPIKSPLNSPTPKSPSYLYSVGLPEFLGSFLLDDEELGKGKKMKSLTDEAESSTSNSSPLKSFMLGNGYKEKQATDPNSKPIIGSRTDCDDDYDDADDTEDDYTTDEYEDDDYEDDYDEEAEEDDDDEDEVEEDDLDEDLNENADEDDPEDEVDAEDLDYDDGMPEEEKTKGLSNDPLSEPKSQKSSEPLDKSKSKFVLASDLMRGLDLNEKK